MLYRTPLAAACCLWWVHKEDSEDLHLLAQWARWMDSTYNVEVILKISDYQLAFPFLSWERYYHAAVVMPDERIIIIGGSLSEKNGEVVNSKFSLLSMTKSGSPTHLDVILLVKRVGEPDYI